MILRQKLKPRALVPGYEVECLHCKSPVHVPGDALRVRRYCSDACRWKVFVALYNEGFAPKEIAAIIGISREYVHKFIKRRMAEIEEEQESGNG